MLREMLLIHKDVESHDLTALIEQEKEIEA